MTDKLNDNDRQRIEQANPYLYLKQSSIWREGAEYATLYEREQQKLPPDNETVEDGGGCYVAGSREEFQKAMDGPYVDFSKPNIFMDGDNNSYSLMTSSDPEKREKGKQIRIHELTSRIKQLEAERSELVKENEILSKAKDELDRIHTNEITQLKIELHTLTEDYDMLEAERSEVVNLLTRLVQSYDNSGFEKFEPWHTAKEYLDSIKTK